MFLCGGFSHRIYCFEYDFFPPILMLQKPRPQSKPKENTTHLQHYLLAWSEGSFKTWWFSVDWFSNGFHLIITLLIIQCLLLDCFRTWCFWWSQGCTSPSAWEFSWRHTFFLCSSGTRWSIIWCCFGPTSFETSTTRSSWSYMYVSLVVRVHSTWSWPTFHCVWL